MLKSPIVTEDLPSIVGMREIETIYDLIKNEVVYKKRLAYLKEKRKELIDLIKTVGDVNAIHDIREQAKLEKTKILAELKSLQDRKEAADTVITEAHVRATAIEADAINRARDQKTILDQREKELLENRKQLNERDKELRRAEEKLRGSQLATDAELDRLKQLQKLAVTSREDYEERRQKLEKAVAGV